MSERFFEAVDDPYGLRAATRRRRDCRGLIGNGLGLPRALQLILPRSNLSAMCGTEKAALIISEPTRVDIRY